VVPERKAQHTIVHSVLGEVLLSIYQLEPGSAVVLQYGVVPRHSPAFVRIQSACMYGDTLLAVDCDCRDQLDDTFRSFLDRGSGVLIYLYQEGVGTGIIDRARAYEMEEQEGVDAVEAFQRLGLGTGDRNFSAAAEILQELGVRNVSLLTNNSRKVSALRASGLAVSREGLNVRVTADNVRHLRLKQAKLGHDFGVGLGHDGGSPRNRCFVIGAAVMDHVFEVRVNPQIGKTRQARDYQRRPGGKGLNQAIALARLGAAVSLLTVRGHDSDGDQIAGTLAAEGVRGRYAGGSGDEKTPQTAVIQPQTGGLATYVGWLGPEHRTLRQQSIDSRAQDIGSCDAVLITLEASEDAIRRSIGYRREDALVVLNASPVVERPYRLSTEILENVDILVGSPDELHALLPNKEASVLSLSVGFESIARRLAELCGITVVITDFGRPERRVFAINPYVSAPVRVRAPQVRQYDTFAATIGMTDVFCSALTLAALALDEFQEIPRAVGMWRSEASPLAQHRNLLDIVMSAFGPAAWVGRSSGGYDSFPRQGPALEEWCRKHPPIQERRNPARAAGRGSRRAKAGRQPQPSKASSRFIPGARSRVEPETGAAEQQEAARDRHQDAPGRDR
jgi:GTP cyclohydrolase II